MMEDQEDVSDVFAIPDFWKTSTWLESSAISLRPEGIFAVDVNKEAPQHFLGVVDDRPSDGYFKLPPLLDLPPIPAAPAKPLPSLDESPLGAAETTDLESSDFWLFQDEPSAKLPETKTWASFDKGDGDESPATFMTEASSAAFDALLAAKDDPFKIGGNDQYPTIDSGVFCACLLALALGRSSLLYAWDQDKSCFVASSSPFKLQGHSGQTLESISKVFRESGNSTKYLRAFVDKIYAAHASPARTALANAVDKLLLTIQSELGARAESVRSLLQLQALMQPVRSILVYFQGLVKRLARSRSDEQLISQLFEEAHSVEYRDSFLRNAICEVLRLVSKPWTTFVEEWIGLKPEGGIAITKNGAGKGFVKVENKLWVDDQGFELEEPDYFFDEEAMPSFVPDDVAQDIFETGKNLRFIRANHPEHRLARSDYISASQPPKLEWQFDWEAISRVETKAKEYENALARFLQRRADGTWKEDNGDSKEPSSDIEFDFQFFGKDESQIADNMFKMFDQPLHQKPIPEDTLREILESQLFSQSQRSTSASSTDFNPHWSLLPLLSFAPIVTAQARAVNTESMRLLFGAHDLRSHLHLQRQYHLLGNGLFCSRLSHALFDPELDTAERRSGVALAGGVMGLRLSGRDTWPPASSELRLALMGVLAESYQPLRPARRHGKAELPPGMDISFAVRDLSPDEIEKCINPDSLEALDFLRLSYKPPAALAPVMTPVILLKYDRVFRLLLRVLRMLYVVHGLFQEVVLASPDADEASLRFRVEAHHFVTRLAAYLFDTGVAAPWLRFDEWLDGVERDLAAAPPPGDDNGGGKKGHGGPDRLRDRHEAALDEVMAALLLRKRQAPVMRLLEDIFGVVLLFAKFWRKRRGGREDDAEARRLYALFRKKVDVFVTVCRGMSEKGGREKDVDGRAERVGEEHEIGRLLLLLDMSGHLAGRH